MFLLYLHEFIAQFFQWVVVQGRAMVRPLPSQEA